MNFRFKKTEIDRGFSRCWLGVLSWLTYPNFDRKSVMIAYTRTQVLWAIWHFWSLSAFAFVFKKILPQFCYAEPCQWRQSVLGKQVQPYQMWLGNLCPQAVPIQRRLSWWRLMTNTVFELWTLNFGREKRINFSKKFVLQTVTRI